MLSLSHLLFPLISCFFSAILGILFLVLLSVTYRVLCSPFCRLPRPLSNFITIFLPLHLSFRITAFLSFVSVLSSLLSSISFLLCMKKKWKGISSIPIFYFSNEKAHHWACPGCALFSTTAWNTLVKWESARYRGSTQWVTSLALTDNGCFSPHWDILCHDLGLYCIRYSSFKKSIPWQPNI